MSDVKFSRDEFFLLPSMYLFYRANPVLAVRDILGIRLAPHQRVDLRLQWHSKASDVIRVFSRGMSKTFGEALLGVLSAVLYPKLKILSIGASGFRQGKMILEEVERIVKGDLNGQTKTDFAMRMVDTGGRRYSTSVIRKDPDLWKVPFLNGSVIATAPIGTTGDAIRGFRANITQVDERKDLSNEIKERVIKPFGIIDHNVVTDVVGFKNINIDSGTLQFEDDDYTKELEEYKRLIQKGSEDHLVIKFVYPDAFDEAKSGEKYVYNSEYFNKKLKYWGTPYKIKVDNIERELAKITTDIESWRAEYLCEPMRSAGDYYPFELVQSCVNTHVYTDNEYMAVPDSDIMQFLKPGTSIDDPCILGVDCAREHDMTAFVVMRVGQLSEKPWDRETQEGKTKFSNIVWAYCRKHMHDQESAILIYKILDMYPNIVVVAMDKRGGGSGVRDQLYHTVKDGKIKDDKGNPAQVEILYDPEDDEEGGIATLLKGRRGERISINDRLRLVTYTDMDNTLVNRGMRNAMADGQFFFSGGDEELRDSELIGIRDYINMIPRQFRMIQTKPTKNWVKFEVPNSDKNKKDLYSATIYAWGEVMKLVYDQQKRPRAKIATIAPTMNLKLNGTR